MAISTSYQIALDIKESSHVLYWFGKSLVDQSTWTEYTHHRLSIADGVTDQTVDLGGCASGDLLFMKTDETVTVKIGGAEAITVGSVMVLSAAISALTISNASGSTATVDIVVLD